MELWQLIISICAGIITLLTLFEKLGIIKVFQKVDTDFSELKKLPSQITVLQKDLTHIGDLQLIQNQALLSILRSSLYQCFKNNRDLGVWTDEEAGVQTKMHEVYKDLNGNGEEAIWWEKKKHWKIVTNAEYAELVKCKEK